MKRKLTNNWGLKIGSVLFAAILWLLVTNINDPSSPLRFSDVQVQIVNSDLITSQGKVYEVLDESDVVDTVTVMLPRSIQSFFSLDNVVAVADMNNLTTLNTIPIQFSTKGYSVDSIRGSSDMVKLNIEEKRSIFIPLKATTTGTLQEGYIVGDITTDQNQVRVSGPESVISRIKTAEVNVGVSGFTGDIETNVEIKLYDEAGEEIPKNNLTLNINNVGANVEILTTKSVPLRFLVSGTPAEGYRANGMVISNPDSILLAGKSNVLKNLSVIEFPDTLVDLTAATENVSTTIDVREYLPGNVELADSEFDGNVTVTAYVEAEISRTVTIRESDIIIQNLPDAYEGTVSAYEEEFPIQFMGLAADVTAIDATQIRGIVDIQALLDSGALTEVEEGYFDVNLSFNLPDTVRLRENITVRLNIREK